MKPDTSSDIVFRRAGPQDAEAITDLMKQSLGEENTEKSVDFWRWKHEENPFGSSSVLLAWADDRLVGIRAFMRWDWAGRQRTFRALRAVDTATHPDYRGRGIFKRLTLSLVEECKREGYDFIFNTPNEQSRPGYLKMGWSTVGRLPLRMAVLKPWEIALAKLRGGGGAVPATKEVAEDNVGTELLNGAERAGWLSAIRGQEQWRTPVTAAFLKWRYLDCPVRTYWLHGEADEYLIFYYLREQQFGVELRLVHCLTRPGYEASFRRGIGQLRRKYRPTVITAAASVTGLPFYFLPSLPLGLILTFRELNCGTPPRITNWAYELGDMELF